MTSYPRWTLRTEHTSYTVRLSPDGPWAELDAWGPLGVEDGPSALDWSRRTHFVTPADAAPAEYLPYGLRPFTGSELIAARPGQDRGVWWDFEGAEEGKAAYGSPSPTTSWDCVRSSATRRCPART